MTFDQVGYNVRCEWGEHGVALLAPVSDVVIVGDVLSFSTAVEIATCQGAVIFPYAWKDETAYEFAATVNAEVAGKENSNKYSLSSTSLLNLPSGVRLVLPSPNGSTLCLLAGSTPVIAGCLRNCRAVAEAAMSAGRTIAVIPAGERWKDGTLRPCLEDFIGAGAIIKFLRGTLSPEAVIAVSAFNTISGTLFDLLKGCSSGREKIFRGEENDIRLAAELNVRDCVPVLRDGSFVRAT